MRSASFLNAQICRAGKPDRTPLEPNSGIGSKTAQILRLRSGMDLSPAPMLIAEIAKTAKYLGGNKRLL